MHNNTLIFLVAKYQEITPKELRRLQLSLREESPVLV